MYDVFVFGSNRKGIHGAGAAYVAFQNYGAKWNVGEGLSGRSYAIPTKDMNIRTLPLDEIREHVETFCEFAKNNPTLRFYVSRIGCGLAGHSPYDIAPMFKSCLDLANVKLPKDFLDVLCPGNVDESKVSFEF